MESRWGAVVKRRWGWFYRQAFARRRGLIQSQMLRGEGTENADTVIPKQNTDARRLESCEGRVPAPISQVTAHEKTGLLLFAKQTCAGQVLNHTDVLANRLAHGTSVRG